MIYEKTIRKPLAWLMGLLLAAMGLYVSAPNAYADTVGTINSIEIVKVYDGTHIPNPLDDSDNNGIVATNDSVGYEWRLNVTDVQDATITQTLPEGWTWDTESFGSIDTENQNYISSYVVSDDGRTVTATFSTVGTTNNPRAIAVGVLKAKPSVDVTSGSVYTPAVEMTLGDQKKTAEGAPVTVLSQPTVTPRKGRNADNGSGTFDFGAGPVPARFIEFRIQIDDLDNVVGGRSTELQQPATLRDTFVLEGPEGFLNATFTPEVVNKSERNASVEFNAVDGNPFAYDVVFDDFTTLYGAWVDVRFWVDEEETPTSEQGLLKMVNTVNSAGIRDTTGDVAYESTTENRTDGIVVRAPNGGPGKLGGWISGKKIFAPQEGVVLPPNMPYDPERGDQPYDNITGQVVSPGAIVLSRMHMRSGTYEGTQVVPPARNIHVYDFWDPSQQQLVDTTAPYVGWANYTDGAVDSSNYVIEYTNGLDRSESQLGNTWFGSIAEAGGVENITGLRVRYLTDWASMVSTEDAYLIVAVPLRVVSTEANLIPDEARWRWTDVNDVVVNGSSNEYIYSGSYRLGIEKWVDKSSIVSGSSLTFEVRPQIRKAYGSPIDVNVQGLQVVDRLSPGIASVDLSGVDTDWTVVSEQYNDDGIEITFRYNGEVNTADNLPVIRYSAQTSGLAPPSGKFQNTAIISADYNAQSEDRRTARTETTITQAQVVSEEKRVYGDNLLDVNAPQASWQTSWFNYQTSSQGLSYFVDLLPYEGDDNGTSISGTATFASALLLDLSGNPAPTSYGKLQYTTAAAATVIADTQSPGSTDITWVDADAYPSGQLEAVTAVRAVVYDFVTGTAGVGSMRITLDLENMRGGDKMVNVSSGYLGQLGFLGETNEAAIDIVAASLGGVVWHDVDGSGTRAPDDPMIAGAKVTLYKANGQQIATTTTDANGAYSFTQLPAGDYRVLVDEDSLKFGNDPLPNDEVMYNSYDLSGEHNSDSGIITLEKGVPYLTSVDFGYTLLRAGFEVEKTSIPDTTSTVNPAQIITYTVTGTNTGATRLDPVVITDDLDGLWEDVTYNNDAFATIDGQTSAGRVVIHDADQTATWTGALEIGESVTITYSVTVARDYDHTTLLNVVNGSAQPPGPGGPIEPPPSETVHYIPGFTLDKTANPEDQSVVEPGEVITYTVTGVNTGGTVLDPVTINDDLSGLFAADGTPLVEYTGNATAVVTDTGGNPTGNPAPPVVDLANAKTLTWNGSLQKGETVTITYSVRVLADAVGHELQNLVTGSAQPPGPGVPPIVPPERETEHPVPHPDFKTDKTSDPVEGTEVHPGQRITYTITGENTDQTVLRDVVVRDDTSGLFDADGTSMVTFNDDAQVVTHGVSGAGDLTVDFAGAKEIVWRGELAPGEKVTVTYSVTVGPTATGHILQNRVTGSAQPPGNVPPITPPPVDKEHPVPQPGFELDKSVNPKSGTDVLPGDMLRYQVVGTNTGETVLDPVVIEDDLSGLNEHVTLVGQPFATIDGVWTAGDLDLDFAAGTLTWQGKLDPGEAVVITYTVQVNEDAAGAILKNIVAGSAQPPGTVPPIEPDPPSTTNPVPGFEIEKVSDPVSGSAVMPGQKITYTITGTNKGATRLDPVVITDELDGLWEDVTYNNDVFATIDGQTSAGRVVIHNADQTATWTGALEAGETVTITYSVTVALDYDSTYLLNVVRGSGQPPGEDVPAIVPPPSQTEHYIPGFTLDKTANPKDQSEVNPGDRITYTVTGVNTGGTVLDPVVISDDLRGLFDADGNALVSYNDDAVAVLSGPSGDAATPIVDFADAKSLTWSGALEPGQKVTIRYSVTVLPGAVGHELQNLVTGSAQPPGPGVPPIVPPERETEHPVPHPDFKLEKDSSPAEGTQVHPGQTITYTLTGRNTDDTVLDPVIITDHLEGLFDDDGTPMVSYTGVATAVITNAAGNPVGNPDAPVVDFEGAKQLTWQGALDPGHTVTIRFTVEVLPTAVGKELRNLVTGSAQPPGEVPPIIPPPDDKEHPVSKPGFTLDKTVNPQSGSAVAPGDVLRYQIVGTNTGDTVLNPVLIEDDLSGINEHASLLEPPFATIDGVWTAGELTVDYEAGSLRWKGKLDPGETVVITYTVQVNDNAAGVVLENTASGSAQPPGNVDPLDPGEPSTKNPVPGFELEKVSDPVSGTEVEVGQQIRYTLTGRNTGATVLDPVTITDDVSGLLGYATYNGGAFATIDGVNPAGTLDVQFDAGVLTWVGVLQPGEAVEISFTVTVTQKAAGVSLLNIAEGWAQPPLPAAPIVPERPQTVHPVPVPESGFEVAKTSNPSDGTRVQSGQIITYTVTGTNTGETALDPVMVTDDMSGVLGHAVYRGDAFATIDGTTAAGAVVFDARSQELVWTGALDVGEKVTLTYSVKVNDDAAGVTLKNSVVGEAQPPGDDPPLETPRVSVEHPVSSALVTTGAQSAGRWVMTGALLLLLSGAVLVLRRQRRLEFRE